jgi:hypothetical protein
MSQASPASLIKINRSQVLMTMFGARRRAAGRFQARRLSRINASTGVRRDDEWQTLEAWTKCAVK